LALTGQVRCPALCSAVNVDVAQVNQYARSRVEEENRSQYEGDNK
jgi:hypothetical protein